MRFSLLSIKVLSRLCILIFLLIIIAFGLSGCLIMQHNLNEGIHSFQVQNYRQAFIRLKPEAEKGHPDAQYAIGYMYYYGQGVVEDKEKALYWIKCAAKQGQHDAIAALQALEARSGS